MKRKIGRNEPCFCGSGKKYKNCCLPQKNNLIDFSHEKATKEMERLREDIVDFIFNREEELLEAYEDFLPRPDIDIKTFIKEYDYSGFFIEWFFFDYELKDGTTPIKKYIAEHWESINETALQMMKEWEQEPLSVYEVKETISEKGAFLEDIFTSEKKNLFYPELASEVKEGDVLVLRALSMGKWQQFLLGTLSISQYYKNIILEVLEQKKEKEESWKSYLKQKSQVLLKLVQMEEDVLEKMEEYKSSFLSNNHVLRSLFSNTLEELGELSIFEACWMPEKRDILKKLFQESDQLSGCESLLGLEDERKDFIRPDDFAWTEPYYKAEAELLFEKMRKEYFPFEIIEAFHIWHEFSSNEAPVYRKKGTWAAAAEYTVIYLNSISYKTQQDTAQKYNVSVNTISRNYSRLLDFLERNSGKENNEN